MNHRSLLDRFNQQVAIPEDRSKCWLWVGVVRHGYGTINDKCKCLYAHRVSYDLFVGRIPNDMFVCHRCDEPKCVNPEHLFLGRQRDNIKDAVTKNRMNKKLSVEQVELIRALYATGDFSHRDLAKQFGVSHPNIGYILNNKIYVKQ